MLAVISVIIILILTVSILIIHHPVIVVAIRWCITLTWQLIHRFSILVVIFLRISYLFYDNLFRVVLICLPNSYTFTLFIIMII